MATVQRDGPAAPTPATLDPASFDLGPGSKFSGLAGGLLDVLKRSYRDRMEGASGTEHNLDNAFWGGRPATLDAALAGMGTAGINLLAEMWDRSGSALFSKIQYVKNAWSGSSRGFAFVTTDMAGLEAALIAHPSYCRDTPTGESEHKPGRCYREIVAGEHGLHYCVHESAGTSAHIDLHQTVKKKDPDGTCCYSWLSLPAHWIDVFADGQTESPFERLDRTKGILKRLRDQINGLGAGEAGAPEGLRNLDGLDDRMRRIEATAQQLATQGAGGETQAADQVMPEVVDILDEAIRIDLHFNPPTPVYAAGY